MKIQETPEYALSLALSFWDNKKTGFLIQACIMRGEKIPKEAVTLATHYIERHPVIDCLEQDFAIEVLKKHAELDHCPF